MTLDEPASNSFCIKLIHLYGGIIFSEILDPTSENTVNFWENLDINLHFNS